VKIPNLLTFGKSLLRLILAFLRREPVLASEEVVTERLGTCYPCKWYDSDSGQCLECTCFIELKAQFEHEKCPKKKWKR
jgi:hypothetical protein